ncbi:CLUMA_CG015499, isoform A [Clunio marinus]|uniref:CLUMA_CG015499, isoform A n=1 Tax=Clunio marinus TaxID=568069 RepID=A0A1J1IVG4_9DIPT|nr:CLUMA_CG015499, isoform A [Clunio marinus]
MTSSKKLYEWIRERNYLFRDVPDIKNKGDRHLCKPFVSQYSFHLIKEKNGKRKDFFVFDKAKAENETIKRIFRVLLCNLIIPVNKEFRRY